MSSHVYDQLYYRRMSLTWWAGLGARAGRSEDEFIVPAGT